MHYGCVVAGAVAGAVLGARNGGAGFSIGCVDGSRSGGCAVESGSSGTIVRLLGTIIGPPRGRSPASDGAVVGPVVGAPAGATSAAPIPLLPSFDAPASTIEPINVSTAR